MEVSLVGETSLMVTVDYSHQEKRGSARSMFNLLVENTKDKELECKMIFIITIIIIIIIPKLLWVWPLLYKYIILFHQKIYIYILVK
jgi:hypothetical protein